MNVRLLFTTISVCFLAAASVEGAQVIKIGMHSYVPSRTICAGADVQVDLESWTDVYIKEKLCTNDLGITSNCEVIWYPQFWIDNVSYGKAGTWALECYSGKADWSKTIRKVHLHPMFQARLRIVDSLKATSKHLTAIQYAVDRMSKYLGTPLVVELNRMESQSVHTATLDLTIRTPKRQRGDLGSVWMHAVVGRDGFHACQLLRKHHQGVLMRLSVEDLSIKKTDTFARVLRFALKELAQFGTLAFEFEGWTVGVETGGFGWVRFADPAFPPGWTTYRLVVSDGYPEFGFMRHGFFQAREPAKATRSVYGVGSPSVVWTKDSPSVGAVTSNRGGTVDAIGFARLIEAMRTFSLIESVRIERKNAERAASKGGTGAGAGGRISVLPLPGEQRSSIVMTATGRADPERRAESMLRKINRIERMFEDIELPPLPIAVASASVSRDGEWSVALSAAPWCAAHRDLAARSNLLVNLQRLGVQIDHPR